MSRPRVGALIAVLVLILGGAHRAAAVTIGLGSGELEGGTLAVGIETESGVQSSPVDSHSASLPPLVHYVSTRLPAGPLGSLEGLCNAGGETITDASQVVFGWLYDVVGYTTDGRIVSDTHVCVAFPDPNDRSAPAPPPPTPVSPTVGDVWRAIALPRPVVGVNPVRRGVTGLETRLWSGGAQTAQVAVTIGEFRITGVARVVGYRFSTDEGSLGATVTPGDATRPATAHRYLTKGAHDLSVASVWRATVTMIGPGGPAAIAIDINTAVLTATVAYPVVEVRTRLVG